MMSGSAEQIAQEFEEAARLLYAKKKEYAAQMEVTNRLKEQLAEAKRKVTQEAPPKAIPAKPDIAAEIKDPENPLATCCAVLVRTSGPMNLGLIARLCLNVGVLDIRLVNPLCEVNCSESRKFANHAVDMLTTAPVFDTLEAAVADCGLVLGTSARRRSQQTQFLAPEDIAPYMAQRPAEKTALVFGNESTGLDAAELLQCQACVYIPTRGPYPSYNLSHAVAIILYTVSRGASQEPPTSSSSSSSSSSAAASSSSSSSSGPSMASAAQVAVTAPAAPRKQVDVLERMLFSTLERLRHPALAKDTVKAERWKESVRRSIHNVHVTRSLASALFGVIKTVDTALADKSIDVGQLDAAWASATSISASEPATATAAAPPNTLPSSAPTPAASEDHHG